MILEEEKMEMSTKWKENYWRSPNLTARAEPITYSVLLSALEKCYDWGAHVMTMDLIFSGLLSKILLDEIISISVWGSRMRNRKGNENQSPEPEGDLSLQQEYTPLYRSF